MTLDELLALLPDNTSGEITAADLRTIVTELYNAAHTLAQRVAYGWSATDSSPPTGKIYLAGGWTSAGGTAAISEIGNDGTPFAFNAVDAGNLVRLILTGPANQTMRIDLTGPSVDQGNYREVSYVVIQVVGSAPANNDLMAVDVVLLP
jgi:hypothetical protein